MRGHGRYGWRWTAAVVLVFALALGLGAVFRRAGLGAAANVVQVLSVLPLLAGVINWARVRRKPDSRDPGVPIRRDELLRTIADASGLTGEDARSRLQEWDGETVDAYLDGLERPGWDFVAAFLKLAAPDDPWRRDLLERRIRDAWQIRSIKEPAAGAAGTAAGREVIAAGTDDWITALQRVAATRRLASGAELSIRRNEALETDLTEIFHRLARVVTSLASERDQLREMVTARQASEGNRTPAVHSELERLRHQLADTQERLEHAERLQAETALRLERSEGQRRLAERLRDQAVAQVATAHRRLAELENRSVADVGNEVLILVSAEETDYVPMGDTDRQAGEELLQRVDDMLSDDAVSLSQLRASLDDTSATGDEQKVPQHGSRVTGRRRHPGIGRGAPAALIGGSIAVLATVVALAFMFFPGQPSPSAHSTATALLSGTCLSAAGVPLTLVVGDRSNVPRVQYPSYLDKLLTTAAEDRQPITLILIDGNPKVLPLPQFNGTRYGNGAALQAAVSSYVDGVLDILNGPDLHAVTPQADVLDALTLAAAQTPAGGNIIVIDSGLQTAGALLYQDQGTLMSPASNMVQFLRQNSQGSLIPELHGRHVLLSGFGYTAAPQASLDQPEQQNVVDQWKAIVTAGGASVCVDPSANTRGELAGLPAVATVPLPPPVVFNPCGITVLSDQGSVGFNYNAFTFRSPSLARVTLLQLAQKLKNGTEPITLIGSTSSEGSQAINYTMSRDRAQVVAAVLEEDGVNASRITIVGDGPNYPGRVRDIGPNGQLILSAAEQDREVIVQLPQCG